MKKLTRKLFISVMTLVLTAMALGTSTFAWFSMNTTVTATGMEVTAKSNAVFLLIGNENSAGNIQSAGTTTIAASYTTANNSDKKVFPAAYNSGSSAITVGGATIAAGDWYTASSSKIGYSTEDDQSASTVINGSVVTEGDKDYMLTYKVYLTISRDSGGTGSLSKKITVTPTISENTTNSTASADKITNPVSCVVVIGTEVLNFASSTTAQTTANNVTLSSQSCVEVTVYVYINGNDDSVKSQNLIDGKALTGNISLQFDLEMDNQ